jgi:hypothetical protein
MTDQQLIVKFNPANAANLTAADMEDLHNLTDAQIDVLADTYPNQPRNSSYIRLYDTRVAVDKQLFQRSTWQNLRNVRKYSNAKYLIAWDFILPGNKQQLNRPAAGVKTTPASNRVQVDLTAKEAAEELKKNLQGNVENKEGDTKVVNMPKATKPAAAKTSKAKAKEEKPAEDVVDKGDLPDDQTLVTVD